MSPRRADKVSSPLLFTLGCVRLDPTGGPRCAVEGPWVDEGENTGLTQNIKAF